MKKKFIMLPILLLLAAVTRVTASPVGDPVIHPVKVNAFKSISIEGDMNIMLIESASDMVYIEGVAGYVDRVSVSNQNDQLLIRQTRPTHQKVMVYVPVHNLKSLEVHGDGLVRSEGVLNSSKIDVLVDGNCKIEMTAAGVINVQSGDYYDLHFEKNEFFRYADSKANQPIPPAHQNK